MRLRSWLIGAAALLFGGPAGAAEEIDVATAHARARAGETLLIDIRTPPEWRETGLPAGATPINLHDPLGPEGFVAKILAAAGGDRSRPVSLICRTGSRTRHAAGLLARAGFTAVSDVRGGMIGNRAEGAAGWIERGLPREPYAP